MPEDKKYQKGVNPVVFIFILLLRLFYFFVRLWSHYDYSTNQQSRVVLIGFRII